MEFMGNGRRPGPLTENTQVRVQIPQVHSLSPPLFGQATLFGQTGFLSAWPQAAICTQAPLWDTEPFLCLLSRGRGQLQRGAGDAAGLVPIGPAQGSDRLSPKLGNLEDSRWIREDPAEPLGYVQHRAEAKEPCLGARWPQSPLTPHCHRTSEAHNLSLRRSRNI